MVSEAVSHGKSPDSQRAARGAKKKSIAVRAASLRPLRHGLGRKKEKNDWMTTATGAGTATKICFKALVHRS
jgi:hypothetical protein